MVYAGNERKSLDKHSVSQAEAEQVFFNRPLLISPDAKHPLSEPHFYALGKTNEEGSYTSRLPFAVKAA